MEVHFSAETQDQLERMAAQQGRQPSEIVEETVGDMLESRARLLEGVERGIAAADRGEFVEDDEVRRWLEDRERS